MYNRIEDAVRGGQATGATDNFDAKRELLQSWVKFKNCSSARALSFIARAAQDLSDVTRPIIVLMMQ